QKHETKTVTADIAATRNLYHCISANWPGLGPRYISDQGVDDMNKSTYRLLSACAFAIVFAALAFGGVSAQDKKKAEPKPAACNSLTAETACEARDDCGWVSASIDEKTKKEKRRAYCRAK